MQRARQAPSARLGLGEARTVSFNVLEDSCVCAVGARASPTNCTHRPLRRPAILPRSCAKRGEAFQAPSHSVSLIWRHVNKRVSPVRLVRGCLMPLSAVCFQELPHVVVLVLGTIHDVAARHPHVQTSHVENHTHKGWHSAPAANRTQDTNMMQLAAPSSS